MKIEQEIKQIIFESIYHKAYINLLFTNNFLMDSSKKVFTNYNITPQQFNVLRILKGKYPDMMNPGEILSVMIDKKPDLTRLVDRLYERKLVDREVCSDNRRKVEIKITKKGIKLLDNINPQLKDLMKPMKKLSKKESSLLSDLLDKIRE